MKDQELSTLYQLMVPPYQTARQAGGTDWFQILSELIEARRLLRGWLNVGGNVGSDWYDMTKALLDESDGD